MRPPPPPVPHGPGTISACERLVSLMYCNSNAVPRETGAWGEFGGDWLNKDRPSITPPPPPPSSSSSPNEVTWPSGHSP